MIETIAVTGSTNADLATRIAKGDPPAEGYWLRAEQQTGGRGRLGREWISPTGNLYCSTCINLRMGDPAPHTPSFVAGLSVYDTLQENLPPAADLALKWPNDAMVGRAKIAGILLERVADTIIVGIGMNVCAAPAVPGREVTSISARNEQFDGTPETVIETLSRTFARRLADWRTLGLDATLATWQQRAHAVGEPISVTGPDGSKIDGTYAGLAPDGALQLRRADGTFMPIYAGDVIRR